MQKWARSSSKLAINVSESYRKPAARSEDSRTSEARSPTDSSSRRRIIPLHYVKILGFCLVGSTPNKNPNFWRGTVCEQENTSHVTGLWGPTTRRNPVEVSVLYRRLFFGMRNLAQSHANVVPPNLLWTSWSKMNLPVHGFHSIPQNTHLTMSTFNASQGVFSQ